MFVIKFEFGRFRAHSRDQNQGLGLENVGNVETDDDEYDAYRKRMMLAYRFRPNPLVSLGTYFKEITIILAKLF